MPRDINSWKATDGQVEGFITQTGLMPVVVLDALVDEVVSVFQLEPQLAQGVYASLRDEDVIAYVSGRSALVFENNEQFRKAMLAPDPRPHYYSFMRHWIAGVFRERFPALFRRLPAGFANGAPLLA